jgi:hypothetical protein
VPDKALADKLFEEIFMPSKHEPSKNGESTIFLNSNDRIRTNRKKDVSSITSSPKKKQFETDYFSAPKSESNIKIIEHKVLEAEKYILNIHG